MKVAATLLLIAFGVIGWAPEARSQQTLFDLFKSKSKRADQYYKDGDYLQAMTLYRALLKKDSANRDVVSRLARCHYFLKDYKAVVRTYETSVKGTRRLALADYTYYAESLCAVSRYEEALQCYQEYLEKSPQDEVIQQKVWRLANRQYLYEDSIHYTLWPVSFNTMQGEICSVPYQEGLVYLSNPKKPKLIDRAGGASSGFYKPYYIPILRDTLEGKDSTDYGSSQLFPLPANTNVHIGPVAFYQQGSKMVFASSTKKPGPTGKRTLRLYFAEKAEGKWLVRDEFPHNNENYSNTDPAINEAGTVLYFSSDRAGGVGGKDIYTSTFLDGRWSEPVNLGKQINTRYDEVFPYLHHDHTLYFSSNGHPGLGGLDVFSVEVEGETFREVKNVGFPLNTGRDDFGITLDSVGRYGYLSSNRQQPGQNDDIYAFKIHLHPYPCAIEGVVQLKEHAWSDSSALIKVPDAAMYLFDVEKQLAVHQVQTDAAGNFKLVIPYYSKYTLRIVPEGDDEYIVSLDVPKYQTSIEKYEVVIVKDAIRSTTKEGAGK